MRRYSLTFIRDVALVRAAVRHGEDVRVVKLIVDTGAARTMLSWDILEGLGYDPAGTRERVRLATVSGFERAPQVRVESFHCLGEEIRDFPVICHDLPFNRYVEGLLGMDFLCRFDVAIRPKQGVIEILP